MKKNMGATMKLLKSSQFPGFIALVSVVLVLFVPAASADIPADFGGYNPGTIDPFDFGGYNPGTIDPFDFGGYNPGTIDPFNFGGYKGGTIDPFNR
jgi:hypothetical protein